MVKYADKILTLLKVFGFEQVVDAVAGVDAVNSDSSRRNGTIVAEYCSGRFIILIDMSEVLYRSFSGR